MLLGLSYCTVWRSAIGVPSNEPFFFGTEKLQASNRSQGGILVGLYVVLTRCKKAPNKSKTLFKAQYFHDNHKCMYILVYKCTLSDVFITVIVIQAFLYINKLYSKK